MTATSGTDPAVAGDVAFEDFPEKGRSSARTRETYRSNIAHEARRDPERRHAPRRRIGDAPEPAKGHAPPRRGTGGPSCAARSERAHRTAPPDSRRRRLAHRARALASLIALLALSACGGGELEPLAPDARILAFGDSLTAGVGASAAESYPSVLESLTGRTVLNAGVSGELTGEGLARLPGELARHDPDLLILLEGGNDILRNRPMTEIKANLAAMIEIAEGRGVDVLLVGVPRKSLFASTAALYGELAEEYGVPFENDVVGSLLRRPGMKSDAVHFNAPGYRALAEALHAALEDAGAL